MTQIVYHYSGISKEEASCCRSKRDEMGRLPVGFCGPDCIRRPKPVRLRSRAG